MALLLNEINWADPVLPVHEDPEWEAKVKSVMGDIPDIAQRVAPSPWLREAIFKWPNLRSYHISRQMHNIESLVVAQENACRFCYGVARTYLRVFGLSEKQISKLERQVHLAELDEKDRAFIRFCRDLARSNPRPTRKDLDRLIELGFSEEAIVETAFHVANSCFLNRVATFISAPPMRSLEKMSSGLISRLMRPLVRRQLVKMEFDLDGNGEHTASSFNSILQSMEGIPYGQVIEEGLKAVFNSEVLSQELKILMFAVVAHALECKFCKAETRRMAGEVGIGEDEFNATLTTLASSRLPADEQKILAWTRETIHYQTEQIQRKMHMLAKEIDNRKLLEAIGVASVANMTVRLAVLLE